MARKVISKDDARERRKIQNRINQENYRKRYVRKKYFAAVVRMPTDYHAGRG
jgi:hypothetical protein